LDTACSWCRRCPSSVLQGAPDTGMTLLDEIFNIDDQLAAVHDPG
jgi:hypothetical protein